MSNSHIHNFYIQNSNFPMLSKQSMNNKYDLKKGVWNLYPFYP